jgi:hypothetical protein
LDQANITFFFFSGVRETVSSDKGKRSVIVGIVERRVESTAAVVLVDHNLMPAGKGVRQQMEAEEEQAVATKTQVCAMLLYVASVVVEMVASTHMCRFQQKTKKRKELRKPPSGTQEVQIIKI